MINPIILFDDKSEYIKKIHEYFTLKEIKTYISESNISASIIIEMYNKGYAVIAVTDSKCYEFKGLPYVYISNIDVKNTNDLINYIEPYFFSYENIINDFFTAAIKASEAILEIYKRDFSVDYKEDSSPVTEADKKSNDIIVSYLKELYPDYAILAEETYDTKEIENRLINPYCIIIDPLDGTKEFVKKNDEFTINIALSYNKRAIAGLIYLPVFKEVYYAARGCGAYHVTLPEFDDNIFDSNYKISVSNRTENLIAMHSKSNFDSQTEDILKNNKHKISEIVSKGSAIKMCKIAEGCADVYYRSGYTMEWDTAAGQIIIEEAGGIMRQLDENESELLYNREDSCNRNGFFIINMKENKFKH